MICSQDYSPPIPRTAIPSLLDEPATWDDPAISLSLAQGGMARLSGVKRTVSAGT